MKIHYVLTLETPDKHDGVFVERLLRKAAVDKKSIPPSAESVAEYLPTTEQVVVYGIAGLLKSGKVPVGSRVFCNGIAAVQLGEDIAEFELCSNDWRKFDTD